MLIHIIISTYIHTTHTCVVYIKYITSACFCNKDGTAGGTATCNGGDVAGQCECKTYVINKNCDECQDEYYGLSENLPDGEGKMGNLMLL